MNNNVNGTLDRMKALMGYGLKTESKQAYSSVEYQKMGADGKNYAIIREGTKYFIKVAPNKQNLVKEDYDYINGFRNRKDNEFSSFANAQKQFDLKMMSLKEAANKSDFNVSSWNLDKKESVVAEASEKMQKEILRERQIMKNAMAITEKKAVKTYCCDMPECPKDNISKGKRPKMGDAENAVEHEKAKLPKEMTEEVVKEEEVLGWNDNKDYMDTSHGTEIGDSAPFDDKEGKNIDDGEDKKVSETGEMENGTVEEGKSMHDADNQNTPTPGVGEGPSDKNNQPFDDEKGKQIDEAIDDFGAEGDEDLGDEDFGDEDFGDEEPIEDEPLDGGEPIEDEPLGAEDYDEEDEEDDIYEDDLESRVGAMEELLSQIAAKLGVDEAPVDDETYEDDDLFDGDDEFGDEEEPIEDCNNFEIEGRQRNGVQIFETRAYREAMRRQRINEEGMEPFKDAGRVPQGNMNKLDNFGDHPAYQKKVMELPPKDMREFPGNYDMNDDSVKNDEPYGEKIGDGAPFEIDPKGIDNAIAEAFSRLKKKSK